MFGGEKGRLWAGMGHLGNRGGERWWDMDSIPAGERAEDRTVREGLPCLTHCPRAAIPPALAP